MSAFEKLTEGIVSRDLGQEGAALLNKWEKTGLLEGLGNDVTKNNMARLLENQAKQLLKEQSTMEAGDVEGFSAVAFPIVRRVFGDLIANELVSVQPMSLPSGLIFFLDFTTTLSKAGYTADESLFGGNAVANQLTGGVNLSTLGGPDKGPYALNNGYAAPTGAVSLTTTMITSGTYGGGVTDSTVDDSAVTAAVFDRLLRYDPDIASGTKVAIASFPVTELTSEQVNEDNLIAISPATAFSEGLLARRLTRIDENDTSRVLLVIQATGSEVTPRLSSELDTNSWTAPIRDNITSADTAGAVKGASAWALEAESVIPETVSYTHLTLPTTPYV